MGYLCFFYLLNIFYTFNIDNYTQGITLGYFSLLTFKLYNYGKVGW